MLAILRPLSFFLLPLMASFMLPQNTHGQNTRGEETFVKIHKVSGSRMSVTKDSGGGRAGRGRGGQASAGAGGMSRRGRGRFAAQSGNSATQQIVLSIPATAKITSGMRARRTFEFRAGAELPGGMRNKIFRDFKSPLSARIVTDAGRITEVNVITTQTDINQSNTDATGGTVIAVRPKRPPMKKK